MSQKIFVTNFNFNVSAEKYQQMASELAEAFANVPGCAWKIWLIDKEKKEAGAVYLFRDEESLNDFKSSPLVASVLSNPALSNFELRERDVLEEISEITRAPLMSVVTEM